MKQQQDNFTMDIFETGPASVQAQLLARTDDPSTSKQAAARVSEFANNFISVIYESLKRGDATFEELAARTGLRPDQVWRRLPDLEKLGFAQATEQTRRGSSGRQQRIWRAL